MVVVDFIMEYISIVVFAIMAGSYIYVPAVYIYGVKTHKVIRDQYNNNENIKVTLAFLWILSPALVLIYSVAFLSDKFTDTEFTKDKGNKHV